MPGSRRFHATTLVLVAIATSGALAADDVHDPISVPECADALTGDAICYDLFGKVRADFGYDKYGGLIAIWDDRIGLVANRTTAIGIASVVYEHAFQGQSFAYPSWFSAPNPSAPINAYIALRSGELLARTGIIEQTVANFDGGDGFSDRDYFSIGPQSTDAGRALQLQVNPSNQLTLAASVEQIGSSASPWGVGYLSATWASGDVTAHVTASVEDVLNGTFKDPFVHANLAWNGDPARAEATLYFDDTDVQLRFSPEVTFGIMDFGIGGVLETSSGFLSSSEIAGHARLNASETVSFELAYDYYDNTIDHVGELALISSFAPTDGLALKIRLGRVASSIYLQPSYHVQGLLTWEPDDQTRVSGSAGANSFGTYWTGFSAEHEFH